MSITYEPIATTTLTTTTGVPVTFSSIPSTYTDLIAVVSPIATANNYDLSIRYNSDTNSNYSWVGLNFNADNSANMYAARGGNTTFIPGGTNVNSTIPYPVIFHIQNYANTNMFKSSLSRISRETYAQAINVGLWRNTNAINEISFILTGGGSTTFKAGTTFTLYGIKAE
jgi:hypothetical protein